MTRTPTAPAPRAQRRALAVCLLAVSLVALPKGSWGRDVPNPPKAGPTQGRAELLAALKALKGHVQGTAALSADQIDAHKKTLDRHKDLFGTGEAIIKAAFELVSAYDSKIGPLWVKHPGFNRRGKAPPNDIHFTVYTVMQAIMDRVYTAENLARYPRLLGGFTFGCSGHFPGAVDPPADPNAAYTVKISAGYLKPFTHAIMHQERPSGRPSR